MVRALVLALALLLTTAVSAAARTGNGYLTVAGGGGGLVGSVGGDVLRSRFLPRIDLGIGYQISSSFTLEATYGWSGTWEPDHPVQPLPLFEPLPSDMERAFWVGTNPLLLRCKWARGGARTEYLKPELSLGVGWLQVTRLLRNSALVGPQETSQMLATVELGGGALLVSSRDFQMSAGLRWILTERRGVAGETRNLDHIAFVLGLRGFLPSPRDLSRAHATRLD